MAHFAAQNALLVALGKEGFVGRSFIVARVGVIVGVVSEVGPHRRSIGIESSVTFVVSLMPLGAGEHAAAKREVVDALLECVGIGEHRRANRHELAEPVGDIHVGLSSDEGLHVSCRYHDPWPQCRQHHSHRCSAPCELACRLKLEHRCAGCR